MRMRLLAFVLYAYAAVGFVLAVAFFLRLGPVVTVENLTSIRVLGAALVALSMGAVAAAHDPVRNRALVVVEMAFMALASLALAYRIVGEEKPYDRAWLILPPMVVCLVLLLLLFPYGGGGGKRRRDRV